MPLGRSIYVEDGFVVPLYVEEGVVRVLYAELPGASRSAEPPLLPGHGSTPALPAAPSMPGSETPRAKLELL